MTRTAKNEDERRLKTRTAGARKRAGSLSACAASSSSLLRNQMLALCPQGTPGLFFYFVFHFLPLA